MLLPQNIVSEEERREGMKGKQLVSAVALVVMLYGTSSMAQSFSLTGGKILPPGHNAFRAEVGFPGIRAAYHLRLSDKFELAPRFNFFYGYDTNAPWVGNGFGAELKFNLLTKGSFDLSLLFEPEFLLNYHPGFGVAFRIGGPGILFSYLMQEKFALVGGMKIPFGFLIHPSFAATIPILFVIGFEFDVTPSTCIYLNAQMGPDILAGKGGSTVQFSPNVYMGFGMML
ncbi:MAG: hypothetical protein D6806_03670 [Deltaproteobacteria bacterium]|nr:MAG: hypothetical protein D6806_03670 [Deltaproteobacteria bacterium]